MTVEELIKQLQKMPQDAVVIQSIDPEGNGFEETCDIELCRYHDGEYSLYELTDYLRAKGYTEEDVNLNHPVRVCIWP